MAVVTPRATQVTREWLISRTDLGPTCPHPITSPRRPNRRWLTRLVSCQPGIAHTRWNLPGTLGRIEWPAIKRDRSTGENVFGYAALPHPYGYLAFS